MENQLVLAKNESISNLIKKISQLVIEDIIKMLELEAIGGSYELEISVKETSSTQVTLGLSTGSDIQTNFKVTLFDYTMSHSYAPLYRQYSINSRIRSAIDAAESIDTEKAWEQLTHSDPITEQDICELIHSFEIFKPRTQEASDKEDS